MSTEAQKKAKARYRKKCNQVSVTFYPAENHLYGWLASHDNMTGYIKDLIERDLRCHK